MPNIELHGYKSKRARAVRKQIRTALEELPDAHEVVTTTFSSDVEDLKGEKMPFLRVITSRKELRGLKKRLTPLGEDIEVLILGEWIPSD